MVETKIPELLAPAGNPEKLKVAVLYGADAVYLGGKRFSLRTGADNFTTEEMAEGVAFARNRGVKVYVTINIFAHNRDLPGLPGYLRELAEVGVDGLIISDPGVVQIAQETVPHIPIHLSTQANTTNWASALFWETRGIHRIVLARELSLEEIREVRERVSVQLEAFVHGAMCISYSGRCLLSYYLAGRDANRGECAHSCRWRYQLVEEKRQGEYLPIEEDDRGSYILSSRDLCMIEHIPELVAAGLSSLKIEGRVKSVHYVATVVKAYRKALDAYAGSPEDFYCREEWLEELAKAGTRDFTTGFYFGPPGSRDHQYVKPAADTGSEFIGLVREYDPATAQALVEQRNRFFLGDEVEFLPPRGTTWRQPITYMENQGGEPIKEAPHPQQLVRMPVSRPVEPYTLLRKSAPTTLHHSTW